MVEEPSSPHELNVATPGRSNRKLSEANFYRLVAIYYSEQERDILRMRAGRSIHTFHLEL